MRPALLACVIAALGGACGRPDDLRVEKRHVTRLAAAWRRPSISVAEDGAHLTYSVRVSSGYYVVSPAGHGPTYAGLTSPRFAPASDRVFYWGTRTEDGREQHDVVAGGTVVPTPFRAPGDLVPARGGRRWAARGKVAGHDGRDRTAIVVDGREAGRHAAASRPSFGRDGARVAWVTQEDDGRATIVVDGAPARSFAATQRAAALGGDDTLAPVIHLSDGRLTALVPDADGWTLHRDGERLATYAHVIVPTVLHVPSSETGASIAPKSIVGAEDAPVLVWWERMPGAAERWRVVRDGAPVDGMVCASQWTAEPPVVSADGTHVAYVCPGEPELEAALGRRWVVLDGRRFGPYLDVWTLGLGSDGSQVAYGAADKLPVQSWRIYANGVPRTRPEPLVWRPRFSPDGMHVLSARGPERGRRRLAVDRRIVTRFDDILYGPEFPDPHTAVWIIRRGRAISRIEAKF